MILHTKGRGCSTKGMIKGQFNGVWW
uniref:Uncharacterized protein n=1 Tax=Anguilla anguilla TaxID=7936 RepID=A0A0E9R1S4_ANGAN